jgi:hypothetical protein
MARTDVPLTPWWYWCGPPRSRQQVETRIHRPARPTSSQKSITVRHPSARHAEHGCKHTPQAAAPDGTHTAPGCRVKAALPPWHSAPINAPELALAASGRASYIKCARGNPDYGDKRTCNRRLGPGGGTRRLHHSTRSFRGFGVEIGSTNVQRGQLLLGEVLPLSVQMYSCK